MAATVKGLGVAEVVEIVDCLLLGAAVVEPDAPELADRRRGIADELGDALDRLPGPAAR
ncbi:hypothetical protein [Streptomyces sp. NRRL S-350]|uniref:hypothetical protein n=1 Tax=Streptomyces sp. NRRL S-350 TaxID=1463902 RepID=UPI000A8BFD7E|nr:hypothetical protein [Streptomyces sp. NRRL S-350]